MNDSIPELGGYTACTYWADTLERWHQLGGLVLDDVYAQWDSHKSDQVITDFFGGFEIGLTDSVVSFLKSFSYNNYADTASALTAVMQRMDEFSITYNTHPWGDSSGELAAGAINICRSSAEFGLSNGIYKPRIKGGSSPQFWGALFGFDAVGYIVGWTKAVIDESKTPGGLKRENEKKRINAGLEAGGLASGGYILKKIGGIKS